MNTSLSFLKKLYMNFIILSLHIIYILLYTILVCVIDFLCILFFFIIFVIIWQKITFFPIFTTKIANTSLFNLARIIPQTSLFLCLIIFLNAIIILLLIFYLLKKTNKKIDILSHEYLNLLIPNQRQAMLVQLLCNILRWFMTAFSVCLSQLWLLYIFILFFLTYDMSKDIKDVVKLLSITNILLYIILFFFYTDISCIMMIIFTIVNIHILALCCVHVQLKKSFNYLLELV
jgi:hypothetical protein